MSRSKTKSTNRKKTGKKSTKKVEMTPMRKKLSQAQIRKKLTYRLGFDAFDLLVHIDEFKLHPDNPNEHPEKQVVALAEIMKTNGVHRAIKVSNLSGFVTAGHGQILSARVNGWEYLPMTIHHYRDDEDEWNDVVADNALAQLSTLNRDKIKTVIQTFGESYDPTLMGILNFEMTHQGGPAMGKNKKHDDEIPKHPSSAKTTPGMVYRLGEHKLYCGDCTDPMVIDSLFGGETAELCFTSPPYADQREYSGKLNLNPLHLAQFLKAPAKLFAVNLGIKRKDFGVISYWDTYIKFAKESGHKFLSWNVWDRSDAGKSMGQLSAMFCIDHEFIFIFGKQKKLNLTIRNKEAGTIRDVGHQEPDGEKVKDKAVKYRPKRQLGTVFKSSQERVGLHPAMFPVVLPEAYINACTQKGDFVFDPFGGAGTTLIAAEKTGRKCLMTEIDPTYCDVIVSRWQQFTGNKATVIKGKVKTKKANK